MSFVSTYKFSRELLAHNDGALWLYLIQIDSAEWLVPVVQSIVQMFPWLVDIRDIKQRSSIDIASQQNKLAIKSVFLWFGRYRVTESRPEHISQTCHVYKALDERNVDDSGNPTRVCIKLMRFKSHFKRETNTRLLGFGVEYVADIVNSFPSEDVLDTLPEDSFEAIASIDPTYSVENLQSMSQFSKSIAEKMYCIVMPLADRNMFVSLKQERYAGKNFEEVKHVFIQLLHCVEHVHSKGVLHADIKTLNIVRVGAQWKLIDLDAACRIGQDPVGFKSSSAYIPPEALCVVSATDANKGGHSGGDVVIRSDANKDKFGIDFLIADPSFDIWSLGCLLYQLSNPEVLPLFPQAGVDDNLTSDPTRVDNLFTLAEWTDKTKYKKLASIENELAKNILAQMLSRDPTKRPSISRILMHPFITGKKVSRMVGENPVHEVFISYRVQSDSQHATMLYDLLKERGMNPYLDKFCLEDGENWKEGFCSGLMSSRIFVCLLSKGAVNNPDPRYKRSNFSCLTEDSPCDNVFLEHRFALELLQLGLIEKVYPILIGDIKEETGIYENYFGCRASPNCPDVCVNAVETELIAYMESQGLGCPLVTNRTVASVYKEITLMQGLLVQGNGPEKFLEAANKISSMVSSTAITESEINNNNNDYNIDTTDKDPSLNVVSDQNVSEARVQHSMKDKIIAGLRGEIELLSNEKERLLKDFNELKLSIENRTNTL